MIKRISLKYVIICAICLFILLVGNNSGFSMSTKPKGPKKYIRVAIIKDKKDIELRLKGNYQITTLHTDEVLKTGKNLKADIYPTYSGLKVNEEDFKVFGIRIETERDASIVINNRKFRGLVDIIRENDKTLLVVNHIDLEEYLCGVLYHEVSHLWPMEALKSQAVASRTFALYQHTVNKDREYDLTNTSFSQVYGGATSEKYRTNRAVIKTYGEVLTYNGQIFPAYFHATCGGHTQDASHLWNIDIPPLKGRRCDNCKNSPHYKWKQKLSVSRIRQKLKDKGIKIGKIYSIKPTGYDESQRVIDLKIIHSEGNSVVSAYKFRIMMGPTTIRSSNFKVKVESGYAEFEGKGWGHGVGLCQWGAYSLAKRGHKKEEILNYYYPYSEIKDIWSEE